MPEPRVSIVLPTLNGARHLRRLLPALAQQELAGGLELLAIDSDSADETRDLLAEAGAQVERIERSAFQHGRTRNQRARAARGEFLVFLSQDAVPRDPDTLARLLAAFDDPRVAGAYARVQPNPLDDPLTARTVLASPEAAGEAEVRELSGTLESLTPAERSRLLRFSNVASAVRASVFREIPFPERDFGEDSAWAGQVLEAGHRIRFVPDAVVLHAHRYGPREAYARYRVDAAFQLAEHGLAVRARWGGLVRGFVREVALDARYVLQERPREVLHLLRSPLLRGAQVLGQFAGSRSSRSSRRA